MKLFNVKTTSDMGKTYKTVTVEAVDYTDAYKQVYFKCNTETFITKITQKRSKRNADRKTSDCRA